MIIAFNNGVIHASSVDKAMILARNISKARRELPPVFTSGFKGVVQGRWPSELSPSGNCCVTGGTVVFGKGSVESSPKQLISPSSFVWLMVHLKPAWAWLNSVSSLTAPKTTWHWTDYLSEKVWKLSYLSSSPRWCWVNDEDVNGVVLEKAKWLQRMLLVKHG